MFASITLVCLLALSALTLGMSVKRIPEGQVYTLRRMGQPTPRLLEPGTHWIWPVIEHVAHRISLSGHTLQLGTDDAAPRGIVFWQVLEPERADAVIEQAESMINEHVRLLAPQLEAMTDLADRNAALKQHLNQALAEHGILVTRARLHDEA
jgi:regulator of protease activity HflC (stomatin/prohibitin superfamily)